jgi:predicted nucleic acid-binding protein
VDAFIVALADVSGGAVIATTDPDDLERLASHAERVVIADIT